VAGVDWGRTHDFTAASLFCCHCGHEIALDRFNQIGWEFQRGRLLALFEKWGVREVCVETNSIGGPNLEALRKRMPDAMCAVGFETTSKTKGPMIQALALAIEQEKLTVAPTRLPDTNWSAMKLRCWLLVIPGTARQRVDGMIR
jgi:hypothetical protein